MIRLEKKRHTWPTFVISVSPLQCSYVSRRRNSYNLSRSQVTKSIKKGCLKFLAKKILWTSYIFYHPLLKGLLLASQEAKFNRSKYFFMYRIECQLKVACALVWSSLTKSGEEWVGGRDWGLFSRQSKCIWLVASRWRRKYFL